MHTRACSNPTPAHGGKACSGNATEQCNTKRCHGTHFVGSGDHMSTKTRCVGCGYVRFLYCVQPMTFACAADSLRMVPVSSTLISVGISVGGLIFLLVVTAFVVFLWRRHRCMQPSPPGDVDSSSILIELVDSPGSVTDNVGQHEPTDGVSAPDLALQRVMDWATGCC